MSFTNAMKAVYEAMDTGNYPVFSGLRQATQATPCVVFEVTNAELATMHLFPSSFAAKKELWTVTVEVACVADTVSSVCAMIDDVWQYMASNPPLVSNGFAVVLTALSVTMTTEQPDDGQQDAERIGTITATLQLSEN